MDERSLQSILDELHQNLETADDLDQETRAALQATAQEIQSALDLCAESSDGADLSSGLRKRISGSLSRFEESHPRLTEVLRRLVDQLAEMGI
jgi:uncharacterized membrane protein YccC